MYYDEYHIKNIYPNNETYINQNYIMGHPLIEFHIMIDGYNKKIGIITHFGIKDEHKAKGHGTRIINKLLSYFNYIFINYNQNPDFWNRFQQIDDIGDFMNLKDKIYESLKSMTNIPENFYEMNIQYSPTILIGNVEKKIYNCSKKNKNECNTNNQCFYDKNKKCKPSFSAIVKS